MTETNSEPVVKQPLITRIYLMIFLHRLIMTVLNIDEFVKSRFHQVIGVWCLVKHFTRHIKML